LAVGRFRSLEEFVSENQLIRSDNFLKLAKQNPSMIYIKRDFLYHDGNWREEKQNAPFRHGSKLENKLVLVGHSDKATSSLDLTLIKWLLRPNYVAGTNMISKKGFSQSLPLGMTNDSKETLLHGILGDDSHLIQASRTSEFPENFQPEIFVCFTSQNNRSVRQPLLDILASPQQDVNVIVDEPNFTPEGRIRYLVNCRTKGFVVCPEGNGVDTHRLWEVLYMGGIPIVKSNPIMDGLYEQLPVLVVEGWSQILSPTFLLRGWDEIERKQWDAGILSQAYWDNFLMQKIAGL